MVNLRRKANTHAQGWSRYRSADGTIGLATCSHSAAEMMIEDRRWVVQVLRLRSRTGTGLEMIVAEEAINLQHV